jgi:DNA processing protein
MKDQLFQIALTKIPLVGPKVAKTLIAYCGGVEAVFNEKKAHLLKIPNIGQAIVESILSANAELLAAADVGYLKEQGIKTCFYLDEVYPNRLKVNDDAPCLLYYKGLANWNQDRTVGIVGTRKPSPYGELKCQSLIEELKTMNVHVFSGMAHGIDSIAHQACIDQHVPTSAVMGTGPDVIYPATNRKLSKRICEVGSLITEYPVKSRVDPENFPQRNRLIAGLSDVIIVVESAEKGGSLITAEFANAYNKDVFAYPGRTIDKTSAGCNKLIKSNKAHLIESAADIAYIMRWDESRPRKIQASLFIDLNHQEEQLVNLLKQHEHIHIDMILAYLNMPLSEISSYLLQLEFKGLVKSLPGKRYMIIQ